MVLRMLFERQDLQRIRLAPSADPLWELLLSVHCLQAHRVPVHLTTWRQAAQASLAARTSRRLEVLPQLVPARGSFPDFLTPAPFSSDIDTGCETLACTPASRLRHDLSAAFGSRPVSSWVQALATGGRDHVRQLATAVRTWHDTLLLPHWSEVRDVVAADRKARISTMAGRGAGPLVAGLPGVLGWDGRTLELCYPMARTVRLAGRGLTLVPSYFCTKTPVTLIDTDLPPVLVFPARPPRTPGTRAAGVAGPPRRLVALLGPSRAEALWLLEQPFTTSLLAGKLGVSVASASRQAATLKDARLITSTRHGASVVHRVTGLGAAVLAGSLAEPP